MTEHTRRNGKDRPATLKTTATPMQENQKRVRHWLFLLSICFCLVITGKTSPAHAEANKGTSIEVCQLVGEAE